MNILVIGGSGFIGSHIADALSLAGHNVVIFDIQPSQWLLKSQKMVVAGMSDIELLNKYIATSDAVYHMAAIADIKEADDNPLKTIEDNIMGSAKIIDLCAKHSVKLMYGSTIYVYSKHGSFYRASKQAVETLIETYHEQCGLEYTILRYGSLYGPRAQSWNGLTRLVSEMLENKKIRYGGTGEERREYIHVIDAAKMSVDVLDDKYNNKAITLTGIQILTSSELLHMIAEIVNEDINISFDKTSKSHNHYTLTPYQYTPKSSIKIISNEYVDIGQGILELIDDISSVNHQL